MCVQLDGTKDLDAVAKRFQCRRTMVEQHAHRIRPTDRAPTIIQVADERRLGWLGWGWQHKDSSADRKRPSLLLHARFETAADKPTWTDAFHHRRCVIITSGWWEVQPRAGKQKGIPYYYHDDQNVDKHSAINQPAADVTSIAQTKSLALAALWRRDAHAAHFVILTTEPTPALATIHDRMPVVLSEATLSLWLNPLAPINTLRTLHQDAGESISAYQSCALGDSMPLAV